ncbi:MAG: hypothetical protein J6W22_06310 [Fibrobacter sp.]|nr:hypothetical protein [Fibrobacter sp.]
MKFVKMKKIVFALFFCTSLAFADQDWFYGFDNSKTDSLWVVWQKKVMDSFFMDPSIDWGRQGLYMFVDEDSLMRLLYLGFDHKVHIYQYPRQHNLRWLRPEAYLEERKNILDSSAQKKCYHEVLSDIDVQSFLSENPLSMIPDIRPSAPCSTKLCYRTTISLMGKVYYSGFYRLGDSVEYFQFKDFREKGMVLVPPLNTIDKLLNLLANSPFTIKIKGCP